MLDVFGNYVKHMLWRAQISTGLQKTVAIQQNRAIIKAKWRHGAIKKESDDNIYSA